MAATPKPDRKNIKSAKRTIEKSKIFPKEKMHDIAKKTAEGMKKTEKLKEMMKKKK